MVELPLGATEDRVCGTINLKEILSGGSSTFEPGLLARANRGILYVDEINLLDDHLVDVLLDSAASGWNTVEREGISIKHPEVYSCRIRKSGRRRITSSITGSFRNACGNYYYS
jgi:magnesium chelatase subunit I